MATINWTFEAEQWLQDIYIYIAEQNPEAALRVVNSIYDKVQMLSQFPEMGYRYDSEADDNVRVLLYQHYRVAYLVKPSGDIDILGVFHGALNMDRYL